jgi:O-antigen ligase
VFAAFVPVILHAVLMTFSRGAMVALLLAAPLVFLRSKHKKQLTLAALAIAITVPILAGKEIREEFFSVEDYQEDGSAQSRFESWSAAWHIALDYPIFGVGIRNADLFSSMYGADRAGRAIHNQFLQILADSGFPALILYLMLIWLTAKALRQMRRACRDREDEEAKLAYAIACGVEAAMAVFFIGGMFLSLEVFELPYLLLLLGAQLPLVFGQVPVAGEAPTYRVAPAQPRATATRVPGAARVTGAARS